MKPAVLLSLSLLSLLFGCSRSGSEAAQQTLEANSFFGEATLPGTNRPQTVGLTFNHQGNAILFGHTIWSNAASFSNVFWQIEGDSLIITENQSGDSSQDKPGRFGFYQTLDNDSTLHLIGLWGDIKLKRVIHPQAPPAGSMIQDKHMDGDLVDNTFELKKVEKLTHDGLDIIADFLLPGLIEGALQTQKDIISLDSDNHGTRWSGIGMPVVGGGAIAGAPEQIYWQTQGDSLVVESFPGTGQHQISKYRYTLSHDTLSLQQDQQRLSKYYRQKPLDD